MSPETELSPDQWQMLTRHLELVVEANKTTNLTRITTPEEGRILHIEDSLSALPEINKAPSGLYGDMGSGAGYPGIPLAIATGRPTVLIDARQKKMKLVQQIVDQLGLSSQVETYAGRAELLARQRRGEFSLLTARALAKLPVLMELASPLLKHDGVLVCYKAQIEDQELIDAKRLQKATGMKLISDRSFTLEGDVTRRIITFQKVSEATVKLPRSEGAAQKNPL